MTSTITASFVAQLTSANPSHSWPLPELRPLPRALHPIHGLYAQAFLHLRIVCDHFRSAVFAPFHVVSSASAHAYAPGDDFVCALSRAYFEAWSLLDLRTGPGQESCAEVVLAGARALNSPDPIFVRVLEAMSESRLGIYRHVGRDGPRLLFQELMTDREFCVHTAAPFHGRLKQLWLVRLLPAGEGFHAVTMDPYLISGHETGVWLEYLERNLALIPAADAGAALHILFKNGFSTQYWNDFLFEAFAGHGPNARYLRGVPDRPVVPLQHKEERRERLRARQKMI